MAYNPLPNAYQPYIEYVRSPLIESDVILLLIVEVIDYSLRYHNLPNWVPTWNLDFLRMNNAITYFNENFAVTVIHPSTEQQTIQQANEFGFDVRRWLELPSCEESRSCLEYFLLCMHYRNRPSLFEIFSLACYASRIALQRNRNSLVNDVAWALLLTLRKIIPYEEYYSGLHFVANMYDQPVDNQLLINDSNDDEGIEDMEIVDNSSSENRSLFPTDPILLFVREIIDYYLRFNNLEGTITSKHFPVIHMTELRYFNKALKRTITHHCLEDDTLPVAYERGFNEETWLLMYRPLEARNFQIHFLGEVYRFSEENVFSLLYFACYSSKIAKQNNRNCLINAVVGALADFLRNYFPYPPYYGFLTSLAVEYNNQHYLRHSQSDDEGLVDEENELANSDENNGNEPAEERDPSPADNEGNEAEERSDALSSEMENETEKPSDAQSSEIGNEAEERRDAHSSVMENEEKERELDIFEWCGADASEYRREIYALGESGWDASEEDNASLSSE